MTNEYVFRFPDNQHARCGLPWHKGNCFQWQQNWATKSFLNQLKKTKKQQPKVGFWNSGGEFGIICGDIDSLPMGFSSFDELEVSLNEELADHFLVTRSSSGKVKILCIAYFPNFKEVKGYRNKSQAVKKISLVVLESVLSREVFECVDQSTTAFLYSFVNERMFEDLQQLSQMKSAISVDRESESSFQVSVEKNKSQFSVPIKAGSQDKSTIHSYSTYRGGLPIFAEKFVNKYKSKQKDQKEEFIRILLMTNGLISGGFDLPVTEISKFVGTSQQNISRWIKRLEKEGQLKLGNNKFSPGNFSKRYLADGELADFLEKRSQKKSKKGAVIKIDNEAYNLPREIPDGSWSKMTYEAIKYHFKDDLSSYKEWLLGLPGVDKKGRLQEALKRHGWYMQNEFRQIG